MAALKKGAKAPDISLPTTDGKRFSLAETLKRGPAVVAFFKMTCPVCQMAFPYLDRVFRAYGDGKVSFVAVSQNERQGAAEFAREYGVSFPVALDDTSRYPVSNAYGITNVPTFYVVGPEGRIELASVGWSKQDVEELAARVAKATGVAKKAVFRPGEDVPDFKAG